MGIVAAAMLAPLIGQHLPCVSYAGFYSVVNAVAAQVTQTFETATFPDVKRIIVVATPASRELYLGREACVVVPAFWVDFEPGRDPAGIPVIKWNVTSEPPPGPSSLPEVDQGASEKPLAG